MKPVRSSQGALDIAALHLDLEELLRLGIHIDVEGVKAAVATLRAAGQSDAAMAWLTDDHLKEIQQVFQSMRALVQKAIDRDRAWASDPARRKVLAVVITRDIAARADELRRRGVRNPVTQAEAEMAERWQHRSGGALNRWLRRNR